ncbi:hypothetical protein BC939DRAFT_477371 [Gamsiella multidivaricata]|uniref:uncharacterized protein n=1 Tax=Gamsiella multidivaricata TaxID=101098 RepID=UPI0022210B9B|nr:uncharacterized protein BC939DRAFT_477371 [Gamsiella multidivaricata]KAG0366954.1 hypothetical protein BGZ54_004631 [Gamsiella multidivaricata]KAI7823246.1 hypothetical protein BC939DRAFT_477371 [Gamsiella multidivaricata]
MPSPSSHMLRDPPRVNIPRLIYIFQIFLGLLALVTCILHIASTTMATSRDMPLPFHLSSDPAKDSRLERIMPPAVIFIMYFITCIPIHQPSTTSPGFKGVLQTICVYLRFAQVHFRTSSYVRPIIMLYLALHTGFKSFIIIQEVNIYRLLGKLINILTTFLPKAVCASADGLCSLYKGAAWAGCVLAVLVITDLVVSSKNKQLLIEHEEQKDKRGPSSPPTYEL